MSDDNKRTVELALGRIFGIMLRPSRPGDVAQYEAAKRVVLDAINPPPFSDTRPNWVRDRLKGSAGD